MSGPTRLWHLVQPALLPHLPRCVRREAAVVRGQASVPHVPRGAASRAREAERGDNAEICQTYSEGGELLGRIVGVEDEVNEARNESGGWTVAGSG